jgi:hypothetical protein
MVLNVNCPACQKPIEIDEPALGAVLACPYCAQTFTPRLADPPPAAPKPAPAAPAPPARPARPWAELSLADRRRSVGLASAYRGARALWWICTIGGWIICTCALFDSVMLDRMWEGLGAFVLIFALPAFNCLAQTLFDLADCALLASKGAGR